jgi:hypothetical protein
VGDRAAEERAGVPRGVDDLREDGADLIADRAVGAEVVLAAEPVVPHPGGVRHGRVQLAFDVLGHRHSLPEIDQ